MGLLNFERTTIGTRAIDDVPLLRVDCASVRLGQRLVLDEVSLNIFEGDQVRITGPNGAGKSTLFNAIMGVVPLASGRITFRGRDLGPLSTHERAALGIRYMKQRENVFPSLTVAENLQLALGKDGFHGFRSRFPGWAADMKPDKRAGMLSGGQKQKLAWAMATLGGFALLLADEPSTGSSTPLVPGKDWSVCYVEHT